MKTEPIEPARIEFAPGEPPRAPRFGDVYHPRAGGLEQAREVFLAGSDLPTRWQGRARFVVLETGFGLGLNFLATWQAWREDARRAERLVFVSVEKHPPTRADLERAHAGASLPAHVAARATELRAAWPPLTPNVHLLDFEGGDVRLLLALGDVQRLLPQLLLRADAIYLDGFAPAANVPMWSPAVLAALGRKAAPGCSVATWSVARAVRDGLRSAGFAVERLSGFADKRERLAGRFEPTFTPRQAPARVAAAQAGAPGRSALIIGAGLAGACAADALARHGWRCTVLERHGQPAAEASGNPGGLFHGVAHPNDGVHARFTRAAALLAAVRYRALIADGRVEGAVDGLLRLRPGALPEGLPPEYLTLLAPTAASAASGWPLAEPAGYFRDAGWISPRQLCQALLQRDGIRWIGGQPVHALQAGPQGTWMALDAAGQRIAEADIVVIATGAVPAPRLPATLAPLARVRGQVSWFAPGRGPAPGGTPLRLPLSGHGYVLTINDGRWLCGATSQPGDDDPAVRDADHAYNRQRLQELLHHAGPLATPAGGRTGFRAVSADRLPLIGAVPADAASIGRVARLVQCRLVPRCTGLYQVGGLGSRGLTWGPLAGEILAAWVSGAPMPVEADLLDAVDPARFRVREARRVAPATSGVTDATG